MSIYKRIVYFVYFVTNLFIRIILINCHNIMLFVYWMGLTAMYICWWCHLNEEFLQIFCLIKKVNTCSSINGLDITSFIDLSKVYTRLLDNWSRLKLWLLNILMLIWLYNHLNDNLTALISIRFHLNIPLFYYFIYLKASLRIIYLL